MAECVLHDSGLKSVSSLPEGQLTESDSDSTTQSLNSDNHAEISDLPVFHNKQGNGFNRSLSLDTNNSSPQSEEISRLRTCSDSGCTDTDSDTPKRTTRRAGSILYRQGHPRVKKSVSFCSMPEDRRVANANDCLQVMQAGAELTKIKSNGRLYRRYYWLSENSQEITWAPTSKKANKARISVDQIKEVRRGKKSECRDIEIPYQDEYVLTILYGSNYSTLELVARTPEEASVWIAGLSHLISKRIDIENGVPHGCDELDSGIRRTIRDRWLMETFLEETGSRDNLLSESEGVKLLLRMNPAIDTQHLNLKLKEIYSRADRSIDKGLLSCDDFISLYKDVASRQEIYFLMTRYGCNDHMNAEDLMLFLETEQGLHDVSKKYCEELISKYEPSREGKSKFLLGIDGLLSYLLSSDCDIFKSHAHTVHHDMTLPLSQYYINSSHKTYLLEDQLKGPSSTAAYARTLRLGCRYIEIDCWDGPTGPIVFHGRTLTSKILFTEVINTVQKYAFSSSHYPLIISLENHCSLEQQKIIVDSLKRCLGEYLYTTPLNENSQLPCPHNLLNKIIIKGKKLNNDCDESSSHGEVSEEDESIDPDWKKLSSPKKEPVRRMELLKELSDLVVWCRSSSYDEIIDKKSSQNLYNVASVSDLYVVKLMQTTSEDFLNMCKKLLVRVYPNCARVDSSNFNPQDMWNCGCQIVTLNQQTQGVSFDLNVAMFKQNGDCGYVLKPQLLRDQHITFNPAVAVQSTLPGVNPQVLQIKVISGHRFPKPRGSATRTQITDPYVLLEIFGINSDCASARTKTVPGNGQNPFFDESFTFYIHLPELAMIRFNILDDDYIGDEFIAQYTISFNCLNTGYRHLNLLSSAGEKIPGCTLFVHISYTNATDKKPIKKSISGGVMSSSRIRVVKEPVAIRLVGIKTLDDIAKCVLTQLQEMSQLRYNVETALAKLKEMCDVSMAANIKLCVKTIVNRASMTPSLTLRLNVNPHPVFQVSGAVPDILKKTVQAYNAWCRESVTLIDSSTSIRAALVEMDEMMEQMQAEKLDVVADNKERKNSKAQENFTWNIRVVKEQLTLLDEYVELCQQTFVKVIEAAKLSNIIMNES